MGKGLGSLPLANDIAEVVHALADTAIQHVQHHRWQRTYTANPSEETNFFDDHLWRRRRTLGIGSNNTAESGALLAVWKRLKDPRLATHLSSDVRIFHGHARVVHRRAEERRCTVGRALRVCEWATRVPQEGWSRAGR